MLMTAAVLLAACSDDEEEDTSWMSFDAPALFFSAAGERQTVTFSADGVSDIRIASTPDGWDGCVTLDDVAQTVSVVVPEASDDKTPAVSGDVVLAGTSYTGAYKSATLFIGVVSQKSLSGAANCFMVHEKDTEYSFAPVRRDGVKLQPASAGLIWQSASQLVRFVQLRDGKISFFVGSDSGDPQRIASGNALIGAYDAAGELLWSWHIWATDYEPQALESTDGILVMTRNLGALGEAHATDAERLASYGLYYQWGRKEPFIGPSSYRCADGSGAAMYDDAGKRVYMTTAASSAETGTAAYAARNPLCFITGVEGSEYDWRWTADAAASWTEADDPCPSGWKVAPAGAFSRLTIAEAAPVLTGDEEADEAAREAFRNAYSEAFGWTLTGGGTTSFYPAAGRRIYADGTIQNIYNPQPAGASLDMRSSPALEAQPWVGLYWTSEAAAGRQSAALYFWFDKLNAASGMTAGAPYARANGMQVRCVKAE